MRKRETAKLSVCTPGDVLAELYDAILSRKTASADTSYTAELFSGGVEIIAKKLGEEAVETLIAALKDDRQALVHEAADLIYHLLVVMAVRNISLNDVYSELQSRKAQSGLAEKQSR